MTINRANFELPGELNKVAQTYDQVVEQFEIGNVLVFPLACDYFVANGIDADSEVLEIGAASGSFIEMLQKRTGASIITLVEPSQKQADQLVTREYFQPWRDSSEQHLKILNGGLYSPGLLDVLKHNQYDAIAMLYVGDEVHLGNKELENLDDPLEKMQRVFTHLSGLLKPGGVLITADAVEPGKLARMGLFGKGNNALKLWQSLSSQNANPGIEVWKKYSDAMNSILHPRSTFRKNLDPIHARFQIGYRNYVEAAKRVFSKRSVLGIPLTPTMSMVVCRKFGEVQSPVREA